jgi:hypothetical protein
MTPSSHTPSQMAIDIQYMRNGGSKYALAPEETAPTDRVNR